MEELKEALKEALRLIVLAIIPIILMGIDHEKRVINIDWFLVQFTALIVFLIFIDSWLHQAVKANNNKFMKSGLTRF